VESANWNSIGYKKLIAKSTSALSERQRERQRERERERERERVRGGGRGRGGRERQTFSASPELDLAMIDEAAYL